MNLGISMRYECEPTSLHPYGPTPLKSPGLDADIKTLLYQRTRN